MVLARPVGRDLDADLVEPGALLDLHVPDGASRDLAGDGGLDRLGHLVGVDVALDVLERPVLLDAHLDLLAVRGLEVHLVHIAVVGVQLVLVVARRGAGVALLNERHDRRRDPRGVAVVDGGLAHGAVALEVDAQLTDAAGLLRRLHELRVEPGDGGHRRLELPCGRRGGRCGASGHERGDQRDRQSPSVQRGHDMLRILCFV